jgi:hypothetical protein
MARLIPGCKHAASPEGKRRTPQPRRKSGTREGRVLARNGTLHKRGIAFAHRLPERIKQLVYLDAAMLENGQSVFSMLPPDVVAARTKAAQETSGA